jgi:AcrR family transcriptional regulator
MTGRESPRPAQVAVRGRTRLSREARREQLLDVAMLLFESRSYDSVSLESIAEQAGVSAGLVHHYFGTKREVFRSVVMREIAGFQLAVAPPPGEQDAGLSPAERLRASLERYLTFVLERPKGFAFVMGVHGTPGAELRQATDQAREAVHRAVLELIGRPQPTEAQGLLLWGWLGFVERVTTRWIERGGMEREALVELLLSAARAVLSA